jgi:uncharacterized protein YcsI (UPF0317 family)
MTIALSFLNHADAQAARKARARPVARVWSRAAAVPGRFPAVKAPLAHIGIIDPSRSDFGDAVRIGPGEISLFRARGVTPRAAVMASGVPFATTLAPWAHGHCRHPRFLSRVRP